MPDADPAVSYAVRDLIADLRREVADLRRHMEDRFDRLDGKLDGKADQAALDALAVEVAALKVAERERSERERVQREHRQEGIDWRRWIWPTLAAIAVVVVGILQIVLK